MYARVTPFKMKPDSLDDATKLIHQLKDQVMGLPGMIQFIDCVQKDGSGYIVAVVESREVSEQNQERVMAIWANFKDHLEKMPTPAGYDVIANWTN
jgi:hypothetical protein